MCNCCLFCKVGETKRHCVCSPSASCGLSREKHREKGASGLDLTCALTTCISPHRRPDVLWRGGGMGVQVLRSGDLPTHPRPHSATVPTLGCISISHSAFWIQSVFTFLGSILYHKEKCTYMRDKIEILTFLNKVRCRKDPSYPLLLRDTAFSKATVTYFIG